MHASIRGALTALTLFAAAVPALAVDLGDEAPEIDVTAWIKGGPVDLAAGAGENVYVLSFFSTLGEASKKSIPQLGELQKMYADQGLVVVGISTESEETLTGFVDKEVPFEFPVARDQDKNTYGPYMKGQRNLPFAVIVNREGMVAWKGRPAAIDIVLGKVMAGKYSVDDAKKADELTGKLRAKFSARNWEDASEIAGQILALDPTDGRALNAKRAAMGELKLRDAWQKWVTAHAAAIQDDAYGLNGLAFQLVTDEDLGWRNIDVALAAALRANELTEGKESAIVDTVARVYFNAGAFRKAVAAQEEAVKLDGESDDLKATLAYYQSCQAAHKKLIGK